MAGSPRNADSRGKVGKLIIVYTYLQYFVRMCIGLLFAPVRQQTCSFAALFAGRERGLVTPSSAVSDHVPLTKVQDTETSAV